MAKAILLSARHGACFALASYTAVVIAALIASQAAGV